MTVNQKVMKKMDHRYFSSLKPKQKEDSNRKVCEILAKKHPNKYVNPDLWDLLIETSFYEIEETKFKAKEICNGKCFKYEGVWIPITVKYL